MLRLAGGADGSGGLPAFTAGGRPNAGSVLLLKRAQVR